MYDAANVTPIRVGSAFNFAGHDDGDRQVSHFYLQHPIAVAFFGDRRKSAAGRRFKREHGGMGSTDTFDAGIHKRVKSRGGVGVDIGRKRREYGGMGSTDTFDAGIHKRVKS